MLTPMLWMMGETAQSNQGLVSSQRDRHVLKEGGREAELRGRRMDGGERTSVDGNGGTWAPVIFIAWIMLSMLR